MGTIHSMTGYALEAVDLPAGNLTLELRSVNSRFLDLSFRLAEYFRPLELKLRERISKCIRRGKVECRIDFLPNEGASLPEAPDPLLLDRLLTLAAAVQAKAPTAAPLSVAEILRWPGMLGETRIDLEALHAATLTLLERALETLTAHRAREGEALKAFLLDRVAAIRRQTAALAPHLPNIVAAYRDKLSRRMEELIITPDRDRLMQEVVFYAQKIDVEEELARIESHLEEIERVLETGGAAGKRLDFLLQELNREANTLGAKSVTAELSQASVELKVLIEQMREQVQNIE